MKKFIYLSLSLLLVLVAGCSAGQSTPTTPPEIIAFTVSPSSINPGGTTTLLWNVTGATTVSIDPGIGQVDIAGTMDVQPTQSTTYTINAINAAGVMTQTAAVTVTAPNPPVIVAFMAAPDTVTAGQSANLQWNVTGATTVSIDQGIGKVDVAGTKAVTPAATTTYTLSASNAAGSVSKSVALTVGQAGPPTINSFTADPATIVTGQTATLQWDITGATSISISPGIGPVSASGTRVVIPVTTTTYTLTATNSNGSVNAPATITVPSATTSKPVVTFTASSSNIAVGGASTLQWNVTGATSVSIDQGIGTVQATGTQPVSPTTTTAYTLTATNANGTVTASATITVGTTTGALPVITSFIANPSTIAPGQSSTLKFVIQGGATSASIAPDIGALTPFEQPVVSPTENTTYTLTATNENGSVTASVTVTVQQ